jgi:UDP-N-acetylmuramoyl-L-alanyl-D-glutamate--2,6-diaminopimelate ligase
LGYYCKADRKEGRGLSAQIKNVIGDIELDAEHTTPESRELHEYFSKMVEAGCAYAVMEVSSHSLDMDRVAGIEYETGCFTNLSQDHLDYHITMDNTLRLKPSSSISAVTRS